MGPKDNPNLGQALRRMELKALVEAGAIKNTRELGGLAVNWDLKRERADVEARLALAGRPRK